MESSESESEEDFHHGQNDEEELKIQKSFKDQSFEEEKSSDEDDGEH